MMPLSLGVSCFSKMQTDFTFLVPAHPGSPGQRAVKQVCVFSWTAQPSSQTALVILYQELCKFRQENYDVYISSNR